MAAAMELLQVGKNRAEMYVCVTYFAGNSSIKNLSIIEYHYLSVKNSPNLRYCKLQGFIINSNMFLARHSITQAVWNPKLPNRKIKDRHHNLHCISSTSRKKQEKGNEMEQLPY